MKVPADRRFQIWNVNQLDHIGEWNHLPYGASPTLAEALDRLPVLAEVWRPRNRTVLDGPLPAPVLCVIDRWTGERYDSEVDA